VTITFTSNLLADTPQPLKTAMEPVLRVLATVIALAAAAITWQLLSQFPNVFRLFVSLGIGFLMLRSFSHQAAQWQQRLAKIEEELPEQATTVSLGDDGVRILTESETSLIFWSAVTPALSVGELTLLNFSHAPMLFIPNRAFVSEEERTAFIAEISARCSATETK
jgi:hypothetical protein